MTQILDTVEKKLENIYDIFIILENRLNSLTISDRPK